jgi:hypothetical protein
MRALALTLFLTTVMSSEDEAGLRPSRETLRCFRRIAGLPFSMSGGISTLRRVNKSSFVAQILRSRV